MIMKAAGVILLAAGVFLVAISILLNLLQYSAAREEIREYKAVLAHSEAESESAHLVSGGETKSENDTINSQIKQDDMGADEEMRQEEPLEAKEQQKEGVAEPLYILRIPKIDSENLVREGTTGSVLADALGHEPGTALIGEGGNCVIAGHRNYSFGKFFNRLGEVEVGDEIYVDAPEGTYSYRVSEIKVVEPDQVEILDETDEEQLTLYTCTPIYIATHRLVIIAKPE